MVHAVPTNACWHMPFSKFLHKASAGNGNKLDSGQPNHEPPNFPKARPRTHTNFIPKLISSFDHLHIRSSLKYHEQQFGHRRPDFRFCEARVHHAWKPVPTHFWLTKMLSTSCEFHMDGVPIWFIENRFPWYTLHSLMLGLSGAKVNGDLLF